MGTWSLGESRETCNQEFLANKHQTQLFLIPSSSCCEDKEKGAKMLSVAAGRWAVQPWFVLMLRYVYAPLCSTTM